MKQKNKTIVCAGALILLLVAGLCYLLSDEEKEEAKEAFWLCDRGVEGVIALSVKNSGDGREFIFSKGEGVFEGNDGRIYEYDQLAAYIAVLGYMKAEKKVSIPDLEASEYTVSLKYEDGESFCYYLGDCIDGVGMYISPDKREDIYLVGGIRAEKITEMITSLYNVGFADIDLDEIRGIQVYTPENGLISMNRSEAPRADEDFYWNMFEPFVRTADTKAVDDMIQIMKEIGCLKRTDRKMDPLECGLDKEGGQIPYITFYDVNDSELTIYLGDAADGYIYCMANGSKEVCLIDQSVMKILGLTAEEMADPFLYHYEIPSVKTCTVQWHGERYELSAEWIKEDEGQRGQRFSLNGEGITGARYRSLTEWFSKTRITDIETEAGQQAKAEGSVTIERLSAPYSQEFIFQTVQKDASLLRVELKGASAVYIKREEVEEFISSLKK